MGRNTREHLWLAAGTIVGVLAGIGLCCLTGCAEHITLVALHKHEAPRGEIVNGEWRRAKGEESDSLEEDPRWDLLDD